MSQEDGAPGGLYSIEYLLVLDGGSREKHGYTRRSEVKSGAQILWILDILGYSLVLELVISL